MFNVHSTYSLSVVEKWGEKKNNRPEEAAVAVAATMTKAAVAAPRRSSSLSQLIIIEKRVATDTHSSNHKCNLMWLDTNGMLSQVMLSKQKQKPPKLGQNRTLNEIEMKYVRCTETVVRSVDRSINMFKIEICSDLNAEIFAVAYIDYDL